MTLLIVDNWRQTEDGRWFVSSQTEYVLIPARVEKRYKLKRNPQKLEEYEQWKAQVEAQRLHGRWFSRKWWRR